MPRRTPTAIRLPDHFLRRLKSYARAHRITVSAAMRIAAQRGLAALEREAEAVAPPGPSPPPPGPAPAAAPAPRRRLLSPGVG